MTFHTKRPGIYTSVSRGIDSMVTDGTLGLMLAMTMTSVFLILSCGRVSMPSSATLIVPSGKSIGRTGLGTK